MKLTVAWIGKSKDPAIQTLTAEYLKRLLLYARVDALALPSEPALLRLLERPRSSCTLVLLDSNGKQFTSEEFARFIEDHQNRGTQSVLLAVGPPNGFGEAIREKASMLLSLGKMTLPHELARVVLLEQLYRAFSILKGHPYHLGH